MAHCIPEVEMQTRFSSVAGTIYCGREGVVAWWRDLAESWAWLEVELEASADTGDRTAIVLTLHAEGRASGLQMHEPAAQRWTWDGRRLARLEYMDRDEAQRIVRED
jgi:hypothetical protein